MIDGFSETVELAYCIVCDRGEELRHTPFDKVLLALFLIVAGVKGQYCSSLACPARDAGVSKLLSRDLDIQNA